MTGVLLVPHEGRRVTALASAAAMQQRRVLGLVGGASTEAEVPVRLLGRLAAAVTGLFNIVWAVVVVLMIIRPGSTTGV